MNAQGRLTIAINTRAYPRRRGAVARAVEANRHLIEVHTCRGLAQENWSIVPGLIRSPEAEYNQNCQKADPVYFKYCKRPDDQIPRINCMNICRKHKTKSECTKKLSS
jgi:hypothetical protein